MPGPQTTAAPTRTAAAVACDVCVGRYGASMRHIIRITNEKIRKERDRGAHVSVNGRVFS